MKLSTAQRTLASSKGFELVSNGTPTGATNDGIWNKFGFTKTPKSSYGMAYQDPLKVLDAQQKLRDEFGINAMSLNPNQDSIVLVKDEDCSGSEDEKQSHDEEEKVGDDEIAQKGVTTIETEGDMVNIEEQPYADIDANKLQALQSLSNSVLSQNSEEDLKLAKDGIDKSIVLLRDSKGDLSNLTARLKSQFSSQSRKDNSKVR